MDFSFKQIYPHIYLLWFERKYDLCMHFLRFQEYYESPKYHSKFFTLIEYMDWYSHEYGDGSFTYPKDWSAFNVPSSVLLAFLRDPREAFPDFNRYDDFMLGLIRPIAEEENGHPFYLIGIYGDERGSYKDGSVGTLDHEIAHAFYTTSPAYKKAMSTNLRNLDRGVRVKCLRILSEMGYHVIAQEDEVHAYCATGPCKELKKVLTLKHRRPFIRTFKKFLAEAEKCEQSK